MAGGTSTPRRRLSAVVRAGRALVVPGLDLVVPRLCPGCFAPEPWCANCAATLTDCPRAVLVPGAILDEFARVGQALPSVHGLARYAGPIRAAVVAGKEHGRRDLPPLVGAAIGRGIDTLQRSGVLPTDLWLVPAPTRRAAARARGGDPTLAMARAAAEELAARGRRVGLAPCLYTARSARDSVGMNASRRLANLARAVRFVDEATPPAGAQVLLIDDVFTSGATLFAASITLSAHGLLPVGAVVAASAASWRIGSSGGPGRGPAPGLRDGPSEDRRSPTVGAGCP